MSNNELFWFLIDKSISSFLLTNRENVFFSLVPPNYFVENQYPEKFWVLPKMYFLGARSQFYRCTLKNITILEELGWTISRCQDLKPKTFVCKFLVSLSKIQMLQNFQNEIFFISERPIGIVSTHETFHTIALPFRGD